MIWMPYLSVLAKRPTALKYSGFFEQLPEPLKGFLNAADRGDKKRILNALSKESSRYPFESVIACMTEAVRLLNPKDGDDLLSASAFVRNRPRLPERNEIPPSLQGELPEYTVDFAGYAELMAVMP